MPNRRIKLRTIRAKVISTEIPNRPRFDIKIFLK